MSDHETTLRKIEAEFEKSAQMYRNAAESYDAAGMPDLAHTQRALAGRVEAKHAACLAGADALRREQESSLTPCGRVAGNPMKLLRAALVGMVGTDDPRELDAMELEIRQSPQPASDKAVAIDAIDALRVTRDALKEPQP